MVIFILFFWTLTATGVLVFNSIPNITSLYDPSPIKKSGKYFKELSIIAFFPELTEQLHPFL